MLIGPAAKVVGKKGVHDLGLFTKTVEINLVGTFNVIRLAAVRLAENEPGEDGERGVIINTRERRCLRRPDRAGCLRCI